MATATAPPAGNGALTLSREERIHQAVDKGIAGNLAVNLSSGGASFRDMAEVCEFAKLMSLSKQAVPPHCRETPGVCLALTLQAIEWRMSPFAVANKSYVVNDRVSYESQLIHAVIEQRAPIVGRLRHEFHGEGNDRTCRVWAKERETGEELSYTSPKISTITPKNSPLWKTKPDLQLFYNTSRDWARVYYPDVIMGVYSDDELPALVNIDATKAVPHTLDGITAQLEQQRQKSSQPLGVKDHVGMNLDGEPEHKEPETVEHAEPIEPEAPTPYAAQVRDHIAECVANGDLPRLNKIDAFHDGPDSHWEPKSDAERDFIKAEIAGGKEALTNPTAKASRKTQKALMETNANEGQ